MIGAVVLAAGGSARMGRPKALLPYGGATFLQCILAILDANGVETVRVVVGSDGNRVRRATPSLPQECFVDNPDPDRGMLSSVRLGASALPAGTEAFLLWPVDHPLVRSATVAAIVHAWRTSGAPVVVPRHGGRRGHPVLLGAATVPELLSAPDDAGARHVVESHRNDRVELDTADGGVLADIDTPEAYVASFGRPPA